MFKLRGETNPSVEIDRPPCGLKGGILAGHLSAGLGSLQEFVAGAKRNDAGARAAREDLQVELASPSLQSEPEPGWLSNHALAGPAPELGYTPSRHSLKYAPGIGVGLTCAL